MDERFQSGSGQDATRTRLVLGGLALAFVVLAGLFVKNLWGRLPPRPNIPLVDPKFLATTPWRQTYADLVKAKADLSDYDCYGCHEKGQPPPIRYDARQKIIIPPEHSDIVMAHGWNDRNNNCYNCHNEQNLLSLEARDGRQIGFDNIPALCGSCHGPIYRDWEAGAHGRISGSWDHSHGQFTRLSCANCHNPHAPRIPTREPAPGPHLMRAPAVASAH